MKKLTLLFILSLFMFSCKKESQEEHIDTFPEEVKEIVRTFLKEGVQRGHNLDIKKVKAIKFVSKITNVKALQGCEVVAYYDSEKKSIFIDSSQYDYKIYKEDVILHELGHAFGQNHRNDLFKDQMTPISIMHQNLKPYFEGPIMSIRRQYYFDELFNPNTPYPIWAISH